MPVISCPKYISLFSAVTVLKKFKKVYLQRKVGNGMRILPKSIYKMFAEEFGRKFYVMWGDMWIKISLELYLYGHIFLLAKVHYIIMTVLVYKLLFGIVSM